MCRYAFKTYKDHYACFACRKAFRIRPPHEWADPVVREAWLALRKQKKPPFMRPTEPEVRCPDCRRPMKNMGLDFKAPPWRDLKQWAKVEWLSIFGFRYESSGCNGPGERPAKLSELPGFIAREASGWRPGTRRVSQRVAVAKRRRAQRTR